MTRWTAEELEELRRADEEIERDFEMTPDDVAAARELDRAAKIDAMSNQERALAEYQRAYRAQNKEAIAEYKRAYYAQNREALAEYQRAYRAQNKEAIAEYKRAYYAQNKEAIAEYQRAYRAQNREAIAEKQRWISAARKEKGYSQTVLAELCGCSQPTISLLERGDLALENCAQRDAICWWLKGMDYEGLMAQGV